MGSLRNTKKPLLFRLILFILGFLIVVALILAYTLYRYVYAPNVNTGNNDSAILYIPTGSSYQDVLDSLNSSSILISTKSFEWVSKKKSYPSLVKPGRYIIPRGLSNLYLVNMLRSGQQVPVRVTFNNIRNSEQLAKIISMQLEADSAELARLLNDESVLESLGVDRRNALTIFIPNTYEFYWNTSALQFIERMKIESGRFWDDERLEKARSAGLAPREVITLASIVDKETNNNSEKPLIAGVYMNRLKKGWPLQADPTLVFITGEPVPLNKHKKIDSPYNTYKYKGLPPGPICIPSIAAIDAVLNHENHDYMFFVASEDLSGKHVFSKTLHEHNRHAKRYRQAVKEAKKNS